MKKLYSYLQSIILFSFIAGCTIQSSGDGPVGPQGPTGPRGPQGEAGSEAFVFEFEGITFTSANDYTQLLEFPQNFQLLDTDQVLVYFLWDYFPEEDLDLWRALPQTLFTIDGTLVYNYDFTTSDVKLFLDANFNLDFLTADFTDNWVVRAVVVPGNYGRSENAGLDYNDYHAVLEYYGLDESGEFEKQRRPKN